MYQEKMDMLEELGERVKASKRKLEGNEGEYEAVKKNFDVAQEELDVMKRTLEEDVGEDNQVIEDLMRKRGLGSKEEGDNEQMEFFKMKFVDQVRELEQVVEDLKRKLIATVEVHEQEVEDLTRKLEDQVEEHEQVVEKLRRNLEEKEWECRECEQEKRTLQMQSEDQMVKLDKQEYILQQLKDKIECPVCMDIPRTGPVPVCRNGHFVCMKCKTGSCPTCRTTMGPGKSLLAVTVLENIEHKCKFAECEENFPLDGIKEHEVVCPHRTVHCPAPDAFCTQIVPLSKLIDHFKASNCCSENHAPPTVLSKWNRSSYTMSDYDLSEALAWPVHVYEFSGMNLVVFPNKIEGQYYFVPVMAASETECSQYKIEIIVHERGLKKPLDSELSARFQGSPLSIDEKKSDQNLFGINEQLMNRILKKSVDKKSFSLSFKLSKKDNV